jgi:hypothetical protein
MWWEVTTALISGGVAAFVAAIDASKSNAESFYRNITCNSLVKLAGEQPRLLGQLLGHTLLGKQNAY